MFGQSSIEFLTTYSFMFLVLSIMLGLIIIASISQRDIVSSSCSPFGGLGCNLVYLYSNNAGAYSLLNLVLSNSQSVAINITNASVQVSGTYYKGGCSPTGAMPGQPIECKFFLPFYVQQYNLIRGNYVLNTTYCAVSFAQAQNTLCAGDAVHYTGSFIAQALPNDLSIMAVDAGTLVPSSLQDYSYLDNLAAPNQLYTVSPELSILQVGYWVGGSKAYAFGTSSYVSSVILGQHAQLFPNDTSVLNNRDVACASPYNSTASIAYTTFYTLNSASFVTHFEFKASNQVASAPMQVYLKAVNSINWVGLESSGTPLSSGIQYSVTKSVSANTYYELAVIWENNCNQGLEAINISSGAI